MDIIEAFVQECERVTRDPSIGYNQATRDTTDRDCSSLVCRALRVAGFDAPIPSFSTRTMGTWLERNGWIWHKWLSGVQRGDILWKEGHTAVAVSSNRIAEACIDERGKTYGGKVGDQTGNEVRITNMSNYNWAGYWRYEGEEFELNNAQAKMLEDIHDVVTSVKDPTNRGVRLNTHDHVKWIGANIKDIEARIIELQKSIEDIKNMVENME